MKYFTLIPAILLSLTSVNALASGYTCKTITGTINQLGLDLNPDGTPACHILQAQSSQFSDVTFLYPNIPDLLPASCFYSELTATLGNRTVTGTIYAGLTRNVPEPGSVTSYQFSAASIITLRQASTGNSLGRIYTKDVIIDPFGLTREFITAVNGTDTFKSVQGHIEVLGNLLLPVLPGTQNFTGTLCTPQ